MKPLSMLGSLARASVESGLLVSMIHRLAALIGTRNMGITRAASAPTSSFAEAAYEEVSLTAQVPDKRGLLSDRRRHMG
jgi:hypothetical protein